MASLTKSCRDAARSEDLEAVADTCDASSNAIPRRLTKSTVVLSSLLAACLIGFAFARQSALQDTSSEPRRTSSTDEAEHGSSPWTALNPNEDLLKWLPYDAGVVPGGNACGFLVSPLGAMEEDMDEYPDVKVYFCIRFANSTTPKGTIVTHCGGPGSVSGCGLLGYESEYEDYNIVGFDQRGIGRSLPTFVRPSCTAPDAKDDFDVKNESQVREYLRVMKRRNLRCFSDPAFQLPAKHDEDRSFNFLEYSGTDDAAKDLNLFRQAIGAEKLSIHGISYGTGIAMAYATMFPDHVDRFILNSPMLPLLDSFRMGWDSARGMQQQYDNFAFACDVIGSKCPVTAPGGAGKALSVVVQKMRQLDIRLQLTEEQCFLTGFCSHGQSVSAVFLAHHLFGPGQVADAEAFQATLANLQPAYDAAVAGEDDKFRRMVLFVAQNYVALVAEERREMFEHYQNLSGSMDDAVNVSAQDPDTWPRPTFMYEVAGQPDYGVLTMTGGGVIQSLVLPQTLWGGMLNENLFIQRMKEVDETFANFGLGKAAQIAAAWWSYTYAWPRLAPMASAGSPATKGIVIGYLYDPNTPYEWAQQARQAFPSTHLITSQASKHGMHPLDEKDTDCWPLVRQYLHDGTLPVNGQLCRRPVPMLL